MKIAGSLLVLICLYGVLLTPAYAKKIQPKYKVIWEVRDNRILSRSVCYDYPRGSIAQRGCRKQAKQLFKKKCQHYRRKVSTTVYPYSSRYQKKRDLFCVAASQFNPL